MKTLDEVITALEGSARSGIKDDAIHYLKEYREKLDMESALPDYYELVNFWSESQENSPLSWNELKQMEGKPVWVEWKEIIIGDSYQRHEWYLIEWIDDDEVVMRNKHGWKRTWNMNDMTWQAYRKEKNE